MSKEMIIKAINDNRVDYNITYVDDGEGKCHLVFDRETLKNSPTITAAQLLEIFVKIVAAENSRITAKDRLARDGIVAARLLPGENPEMQHGDSRVEILREIGESKYQVAVLDPGIIVNKDRRISCRELMRSFHFNTVLAMGLAVYKKLNGLHDKSALFYKNIMLRKERAFGAVELTEIEVTTTIDKGFGTLKDLHDEDEDYT